MSRLIYLKEQLLQTSQAISQTESALLEYGDSVALQASAQSLLKRRRILEDEFLHECEQRGDDVCSYRILTAGPSTAIGVLTQSLASFQKLFSVVFEAIKSGRPRNNSRLSADVVEASSFDFGYSYSGSLGFVLTIPNERLLLVESDLDQTIDMLFKLAKCESSDEIKEFAQGLGTAPIECMNAWASSHAEFGLGASIHWQRGQEVQSSLLAELPVFERIRDIIGQTSETEEVELTIEGLLVGADTTAKTFHLVISSDSDIRGKFEDAISPSQTVELPRRYRAYLRKSTTTIFSTNKTQVKYFLNSIESINP